MYRSHHGINSCFYTRHSLYSVSAAIVWENVRDRNIVRQFPIYMYMLCVSCNRKRGSIAKYNKRRKKKINWIVWHVIKLRMFFHIQEQ